MCNGKGIYRMKSKTLSIVLIFCCFYCMQGQQAIQNDNQLPQKPRIGFLVVATGKYIRYIDPLFKSAEQYFLPGHERTFFVFTDHVDEAPKGPNIVAVYQKRLGWPYDTMMRCKIYVDHKELYEGIDYLFACDADTLCVDVVGDEILGDLVATRHPCFLFGRRGEYETNQDGLAYVPPHEGEFYFAGGFYGGKTSEFIAMNQTMYERAATDLEHGIMPRWHDESHLNRYFIDHKPTLILSPEYCWAAPWCEHLHRRMVVAGKEPVRD